MGVNLPERLYGIIGWPLGQSLSPLVHNTAFHELSISAAYMAWPLAPEKLDQFAAALGVYRVSGLSVTIPHKIEIMAFLDNLSENAAMAGAVNTLFWRDAELCGDNTDVTGFLAPIRGILAKTMSILLLGAGGAARACAAGLKLSGCQSVRVASPGNRRQYELAERFAFMPIPWARRYEHEADLIINATPLGMKGEHVDETPYDFASAPRAHGGYAYDLVYNPVMTRFLKDAQAQGRKIITGMEMFYWQADAQFRIWTGRGLPQKARQVLEEALA